MKQRDHPGSQANLELEGASRKTLAFNSYLLEQELPLPYELSCTLEHVHRHCRLSRCTTGSVAVFESKLYD